MATTLQACIRSLQAARRMSSNAAQDVKPAALACPPADRVYHSADFPWQELVPSGLEFERRYANASRDDADEVASKSGGAWQSFYVRNRALFFKPRHFVPRAFPGVLDRAQNILEIGAGNGSNMTLLEALPRAKLFASDIAPASLQAVALHPLYATMPGRCQLFAWDAVEASVPARFLDDANNVDDENRKQKRKSMPKAPEELISDETLRQWTTLPVELDGGMDVTMLMFVLSAVHPRSHLAVLTNVFNTLKPGGTLCFRDYGLYDAAQLRATDENVLTPRLHVRGDGTLSYYFAVDEVSQLLSDAGFIPEEVEYCTIRAVNRKKGVTMDRVWVHAKATKPLS